VNGKIVVVVVFGCVLLTWGSGPSSSFVLLFAASKAPFRHSLKIETLGIGYVL
jgi:hypothetical protein